MLILSGTISISAGALIFGRNDFFDGYDGLDFSWIILYAMHFSKNLCELWESIFKIYQDVDSYNKIMKFIIKRQRKESIATIPYSTASGKEKSIIYFHNVSTKAFENLNFALEEGDRVVIFGKSGGGKSTIIKLLLGFIQPDKGQVFFKEKQIVSIHDIRDNLCYIQQAQEIKIVTEPAEEPAGEQGCLFRAIKAASKTASSDDVIKAAEMAYLHKEIRDPEYKKTGPVAGLSGGQKQRVAIARGFLRKQANLFLLDEPTSALDSEAKKVILENLKKILEKKSETPSELSSIESIEKRQSSVPSGKIEDQKSDMPTVKPTLLVVTHEPEAISEFIDFNKAIVFTNEGIKLWTQDKGSIVPTKIGTFTSKTLEEMSAGKKNESGDVDEKERVRKILGKNTSIIKNYYSPVTTGSVLRFQDEKEKMRAFREIKTAPNGNCLFESLYNGLKITRSLDLNGFKIKSFLGLRKFIADKFKELKDKKMLAGQTVKQMVIHQITEIIRGEIKPVGYPRSMKQWLINCQGRYKISQKEALEDIDKNAFPAYVDAISENYTWGDIIEMHVASYLFSIKIVVYNESEISPVAIIGEDHRDKIYLYHRDNRTHYSFLQLQETTSPRKELLKNIKTSPFNLFNENKKEIKQSSLDDFYFIYR